MAYAAENGLDANLTRLRCPSFCLPERPSDSLGETVAEAHSSLGCEMRAIGLPNKGVSDALRACDVKPDDQRECALSEELADVLICHSLSAEARQF